MVGDGVMECRQVVLGDQRVLLEGRQVVLVCYYLVKNQVVEKQRAENQVVALCQDLLEDRLMRDLVVKDLLSTR